MFFVIKITKGISHLIVESFKNEKPVKQI